MMRSTILNDVPELSPPITMAGFLRLAASPSFALMAGLATLGSPVLSVCFGTASPLPINDMTLMYGLMSVFGLAPWLDIPSIRFQRPSTERTRNAK